MASDCLPVLTGYLFTSSQSESGVPILMGHIDGFPQLDASVDSIPTLIGHISSVPPLDIPEYEGEYVVSSMVDENQILETANKILKENVVVEKIRYQETTNTSEGITAYIGR